MRKLVYNYEELKQLKSNNLNWKQIEEMAEKKEQNIINQKILN
jgi:hypothetical protein